MYSTNDTKKDVGLVCMLIRYDGYLGTSMVAYQYTTFRVANTIIFDFSILIDYPHRIKTPNRIPNNDQ